MLIWDYLLLLLQLNACHTLNSQVTLYCHDILVLLRLEKTVSPVAYLSISYSYQDMLFPNHCASYISCDEYLYQKKVGLLRCSNTCPLWKSFSSFCGRIIDIFGCFLLHILWYLFFNIEVLRFVGIYLNLIIYGPCHMSLP